MSHIDVELFSSDLINLVYKKMNNLADELLNNMKRESSKVTGLPKDWISELENTLGLKAEKSNDKVEISVGLRANGEPSTRGLFIGYISNYGMGQNSDRSNVDLKNYMQSIFFNPARGNGLWIYTRKDKYYDVDSDSWKQGAAENGKTKKIPAYGKHPAFHWYENSIKLLGGESGISQKIQEIIDESVNELSKNIMKYIKLN